MRLLAIAAVAIALGLSTTGAYPFSISAAPIEKAASTVAPLTAVHYTGYYHHHRHWRHHSSPLLVAPRSSLLPLVVSWLHRPTAKRKQPGGEAAPDEKKVRRDFEKRSRA